MLDNEIPSTPYQPWQPMTDPGDLKALTKLCEELGECVSAAMRCTMQGIDEKEPKTGYVNRHWLEDEIADVYTLVALVTERFELDVARIKSRSAAKTPLLSAWING